MADPFFHLRSDTEDKIITREQRIYRDTMVVEYGEEFSVTTTSNAPRLKIKFFLDVLRRKDDSAVVDNYYRIGRYYELEHNEQCQIFNSLGYTSLTFYCSENSNGTFSCKLVPSDDTYILYISSVVFEDSFYNPSSGWLNPDNPDNLIDNIVQEVPPEGGGKLGDTYLLIRTRPFATATTTNTYTELYNDGFISVGAYYEVLNTDVTVLLFPLGDYRILDIDSLAQSSIIGINGTSETAISTYTGFATASINFSSIAGVPTPNGFNINSSDSPSGNLRLESKITWRGINGNIYSLDYVSRILFPNNTSNTQYFLQMFYTGKHPFGVNPTI